MAKRKGHGETETEEPEESQEPEAPKAPPPSAYTAAEVHGAITRARAALAECGDALAAAEEKVVTYRDVADRTGDLIAAHDVLKADVATLEREVRQRRADHDQEMAEWAQTRAAELRAHGEALEQRRVKMEEDLAKRQQDRDAAHAAREKKLGEAEQAARTRALELQDEIRVLSRQHEALSADVRNLQALKDSTRDDIAALRQKLG